MSKKYTGSLSLDWYNKQKSVILESEGNSAKSDIIGPRVNWVNREDSLFYEIVDEEGKGLEPYWVDRNDIRVKEARPLNFKKAFKVDEKKTKGPAISYEIKESLKDDDTISNMLIKGDNLLALNSLVKHFENRPDEEKVKCIYIDPPYNTGSAFMHYSDNLEHSQWLTLMRDRLALLKKLLTRSGSIWISIDDDEAHYLKVICDEIFGRDNFIASNVWQKRYSRENREAIGDVHEYILVYAVDAALFKHVRNKVPPTEEQLKVYKNPNNDPRGRWRSVPMTAQAGHAVASQFYKVKTPGGAVHTPSEGRCWGVSESTFEELKAKGRIWFGADGNSQPNVIRYLSEIEGFAPWTWWPSTEVGHTDEAKKEMHELFGKKNAFDTPKPERLLKRIIEIATDENDIVLDVFLGSGTTAAVCQKMKRRWIGVELGEHAETHIIPRMKQVITGEDQGGISEELKWKGGGSFRYFHVGPSIISNKKGERDFNWKLGKNCIEESLLSSYDYVQDLGFNFPSTNLFKKEDTRPIIGIQKIGEKTRVAIISLQEPDSKATSISFEEASVLYEAVKAKYRPEYVNIFTNRGVDIASDSKPEDLEVIKVPHAIFAELEK